MSPPLSTSLTCPIVDCPYYHQPLPSKSALTSHIVTCHKPLIPSIHDSFFSQHNLHPCRGCNLHIYVRPYRLQDHWRQKHNDQRFEANNEILTRLCSPCGPPIHDSNWEGSITFIAQHMDDLPFDFWSGIRHFTSTRLRKTAALVFLALMEGLQEASKQYYHSPPRPRQRKHHIHILVVVDQL